MANSEQASIVFSLRCPKCGHDAARPYVHSHSVLTVTCMRCSHQWANDVATLPEAVRQRLAHV